MQQVDIDALYDFFCAGLPANARQTASELAFRLALAPHAAVPWSNVFKHDITLRAPTFFAEAMPDVDPTTHQQAILAHMLSLIEAFGTDRVADGQAVDGPELREVLELVRQGRDAALHRVGGSAAVQLAQVADETTRRAIRSERRLFATRDSIAVETYQNVSADKQAVGLPASVALARAAGFTKSEVDLVRQTLMSVCLGLQYQDDVIDWEDDWTRGGAWAVLLAQGPGRDLKTFGRAEVLSSGILARLLALSAGEFRRARETARALGASRLEAWLQARADEAQALCESETRSVGYVARWRKLAPWALEVLD